MNGKGSKPRPIQIPREKFDENWDAIFRKCLDKKKVKNESSRSDSDNRSNNTGTMRS